MCSIFGAAGAAIDLQLVAKLRDAARDRGRDGGRVEWFTLHGGKAAVLGNWRATPTPEVERAPFQPYDGLVHNGTIANDAALGARPGEVDSMVLARVLKRTGVGAFAGSLAAVVGSYALAVQTPRTVLVACNYKPLHYWSPDEGKTVYFSSMARHFAGVCPTGQAPVQLPPYTARDLLTGEQVPLPRRDAKRAVVVASAGLDSTTAAAALVAQGYEVCLLHFRYGCNAEAREEARIISIAEALGCRYAFLDLPYAQLALAGESPLFGHGRPIAAAIAGAEYAHEWVPARNLVMVSLAAAYAEANGYHAIALGTNLEESGSYPDNEEQMTAHLDAALAYAVQNGYHLRLLAPLGNLMKHEIVALGVKLGAPLHLTWSCYRGGATHCGACGPCFMRREAFKRNGLADPVFATLGA